MEKSSQITSWSSTHSNERLQNEYIVQHENNRQIKSNEQEMFEELNFKDWKYLNQFAQQLESVLKQRNKSSD